MSELDTRPTCNWIACKDRPPPAGESVQVAVEFDHPGDWRIKTGGINPETGQWQVFGASWTPSHWAEQPVPPGQLPEPMNYDPNLTTSGRMATQTVRLTFGLWGYRKTMEVQVGGNCTGLTVIDTAVEVAYGQLEQRGIYGTDETYAVIYMPNHDGSDVLECCDDDEDWPAGDEWLKSMLVAAEIVAIEPDASR